MAMLPDAVDARAELRLAAMRGGAVARVGAVGQAERSRPVDPARVTDLRWTPWPRPDPALIPIGDITQFQTLVYGMPGLNPAAGVAADSAADARWPSVHAAMAPGAAPRAGTPVAMTADEAPADRIALTLQHLRVLRGL